MANVLFALVAFGSQLLVAKFLTEEELGYIKIFQSYAQILSIVAGMGFSTSVLVLCADPKYDKRKSEILQVAFYTVLPISLLIWFLFLIITYFNLATKIEEVKYLFFNFSFIIVITALTALFTAFFQANREFKKFAGILIFTKILSLLFIVIFTYLYGLSGFMHGLWIGLVITLIFYTFFVNNYFTLRFQKSIKNFYKKVKEQLAIGVYGLGANVFGNISIHLDIILLGYFYANNPKLIGQYGFASIFVLGLSMFQGTVVQVVTPFFSKHLTNKETLFNLYKKYNFILFLGALAILFLSYITLPIFIQYLYADKFNVGLEFLKILLFVWFFRCLNAINVGLITSIGKTKTLNLINLISVCINAFIIIICIKYFNLKYMIYSMVFGALLIVFISNTIIKKKNYVYKSH